MHMHLSYKLATFGAVAVLVAACSSDNGGALVTPTTHYNLALEVTPATLPTIAEDDSTTFAIDVRDVDTKLVAQNMDITIKPADDNIELTTDGDGNMWVHAVGPNSSSIHAEFTNFHKDSTITLDVPVTITAVPVGSVVIDSATFTGDTKPRKIDAAVPIAMYSDTVNGGEQVVLHATVTGTSNNDLPTRRRVWTTDDSTVATVGSDGTVTAEGPGTAHIIVTADGVADSATVNVTTLAVDSVAVTPATDTLAVGATTELSATPVAANGNKLTDRTVTWTSDNDGIAVVSSEGLVTAVAAGTAHITATAEGKSGVVTIVVK